MRRLIAVLVLAAAAAVQTSVAPAADASHGEELYRRSCRFCHQIGANAKNSVGPMLNGIVGRKAATRPDFVYSDALSKSAIIWDEATLMAFLAAPAAAVPHTKMTFAGYGSAADGADVVAYLKRFDADGEQAP